MSIMNQTNQVPPTTKTQIQLLEEQGSTALDNFRLVYEDAPLVVSVLESALCDDRTRRPWMIEMVLAQITARTIPLPRITPKEDI